MLLLAARNLRARPGRTLFTAIAIALGVALVFAGRLVGAATEAANQQARVNRLAGADLEISSATRVNFPAGAAEAARARPEVEATAPLLRARAEGSDLSLLGLDALGPLRPYELAAGQFFSAPEAPEILLPLGWAAQHGLGVGQSIELSLLGQAHTFTIVGLLREESLPGGRPAAWVPIQTLQSALAAPGEVTTILVRLKPNTPLAPARAALQTALGAAYVVSSVQAGAVEGDVVQQALTGAAMPFAGVVILLAGAFFIYNAFAITLTERVHEIGQLRALGMTRGQVLRLTLAEAVLVALAGSAAGLVLGYALGLLIAQAAGAGPLTVPADGLVLAVGLGLLITVGVVLNLAWQAGRVSPLTALRVNAPERAAPRRTAWSALGAAAGLGLFAVLYGQMLDYWKTAPVSMSWQTFFPPLVLGAAVLFALPLVTRGLLRLGTRWRWGVGGRLALDTLARQPGRAALTTVTLTISLMLVIFLTSITQGIAASFVENYASVYADYDFALGRNTTSDQVAPALAPALQADLDALAAETEMLRYGSIPVADPNSYPFGVSAPAPVYVGDLEFFNRPRLFRAVEGSWAEAEKYFAAGPAVAISEIAARVYHLHPGDKLPIDTYEGRVDFTVALVSSAFIFDMEAGIRYFHIYPSMFFFRFPAGADPEAIRIHARDLARRNNLQMIDDLPSFLSGFLDIFLNSILALFGGLTSISGIVAALGIANTLVASVLERQRELGTLRALGFTRAQVRGLVVIEAGLLGLIGSLLGVLGGLAMGYAAQQLINAQLATVGFVAPAGLPLPWGGAAFALIAGPALAMLVALWPADRAAAVDPAVAMRAEGATGFRPPARHLGPAGLRGVLARLPLAAKLSITTGLVIILTIAALTAVRMAAERRLIEDNIRAIFARATELLVGTSQNQLPAEVTALTPALIQASFTQSGASVDSLNQLFQGGQAAYDFELKYAFITDPGHRVLAGSRPEFNNLVLTDTVPLAGANSSVRLTDWAGERVFESTINIQNQAGRTLGYAVVGVSAEPVDRLIGDIIRGSLWMMAAALAVAVMLTVYFTRRALAPLAQIASASHAVARGDLEQRVPEDRWDDVGRLSRAFNDMVAGLTERERLRDLFGRYLSKEVSEAVLAGQVTLTGEKREITCLYVDMRGSTSFAERYGAAEVVAALNEYFEVIILATEAHGGIVNRFVGDEVVCIFGAPRAYRDHAERAVRAALAARQGMAYVNQKRQALGKAGLTFGMGLNTGEVVAGATGSEERQEYTVIGDAMNAGARIQALTKTFPDQDLLLSEFTLAALGAAAEDYVFIDLGPAELRGKSQLVRLYGLAGRRAAAGPPSDIGRRAA
ncbi:MAG: ABC transporter permease [Anaerolineales bacterium]|nr:ABC transporter permease [Anaerolineales bacterium]